uniref:Kinesin n=1 Tax=Bodo saltans TaxID=75058 RepID=B6DTB8_BODSA|nr:hypothetical protein [Bodo saltans]
MTSPSGVIGQSQATLVVSSATLSEGTVLSCDADHNRLQLGSHGVLSGRRVANAPTQGELARLLSSAILNQPTGSSATHYYVLAGSGVEDALLLRIVAQVCAEHAADAYCHVFASVENTPQLVCETLTFDDLYPFAGNSDITASTTTMPAGGGDAAPPLRGIAYITVVFRQSASRAVIVGGERISITMISLLEIAGGDRTSVFLSIGNKLSPANALSLVHEVEALTELLKGDSVDVSLDTIAPSNPQPLQPIDHTTGRTNDSIEIARLEEELRGYVLRLDEARREVAVERDSCNRLRMLLEESQAALSSATRRASSAEANDHARQREERERHHREREGLTLQIDALQRQVDHLSANNRTLEERILRHQQERDDHERDRHAWQRQIDAAELRSANMSSVIMEAKEEFQRHQKEMQRELMQTAMDFQIRERQWQRELTEAFQGREDQDRCVAELEARVEAQSRLAARDAEQFAAHHHDTEMESLLHQVKALSPLGKLLTLSAAASPFRHHHNEPMVHGALRLDPYPSHASQLTFQRDNNASPHRLTRRSPSGHRTLVSPHPGDRNLEF